LGIDIFGLSGRVVVVTGGLGQLGRQYTYALSAAKARVAVLDLAADQAALQEAFGPLAEGGSLLPLAADVTSRASLEDALARLEGEWETPFGLINNAALDSPPGAPAEENGPFETYPEASFDRVMEVNVKGVFLACQVFGGAMALAGRGSIVNICSTYGVVSPDQRLYAYRRQRGEEFFKPVAYSVSKSALLNLTRYLATYWGPRGVRVNTLTLGGVFNHQDPEFLEGYAARTPLGRMAQEDDYNGAVLYLMSGASSYMTGANLVIDGGWTAW
jgi:NAD(P)-dependent dehydrogenase (short-subunit alcohol dehydrogenase family)